ncbi:cytidine deaminase [Weissella halotolerans]|uniref:Blasticidin s deaminase n=1 Tax=Weissella halotolerans DSM 20190 TaxID=1123500 RepID=A0A0R2FZ23_9LACO|nr:cytidine deaminase [Weissella halotolerans]KRN33456.1 blasticidin s deaminase [Weissella halotolerans DSM 20190]
MTTKKNLFEAVKTTINTHYPMNWGGAAGVLLADGSILTSISPEFENATSSVCMELGSYLEAAKLKKTVVASLCLIREETNAEYKVLTPCGVCQERLHLWGDQVECAITIDPYKTYTKGEEVSYATLKSLTPYHWLHAYRS